MKKDVSLSSILGDFDPANQVKPKSLKEGGPVTIWLPAEHKARYDRLQEVSDRRFCKKIRELIIAAMDFTEERAS